MALDDESSRRIERLEREVESLRRQLGDLRGSLRDHMSSRPPSPNGVEVLLRQRGLSILSSGRDDRVLPSAGTPLSMVDDFYGMMRRYSFRLFLRDLIQFPEAADVSPLTRYCSRKTALRYLGSLEPMGFVALGSGGSYRFLPRHIVSFGPTLEWYVSEIFQREFLAPSLFSLRLESTRFGGDYDVIAVMGGQLIYVEVKSSPPRGVELPAVQAFLNRLRDLQPQMAIFLVDTELRMLDKMVPLFDESLRARSEDGEIRPIERIVDEIFHIGHTVFISNSRRGITTNLRVCIRHGSHHGRRGRLPVGPA